MRHQMAQMICIQKCLIYMTRDVCVEMCVHFTL